MQHWEEPAITDAKISHHEPGIFWGMGPCFTIRFALPGIEGLCGPFVPGTLDSLPFLCDGVEG